MTNKKVYFLSDFHLGIPNSEDSLKREKIIVSWLDSIKNETSKIFLLGDIFDFWFEYNKVIPKGYSRLLGKLAELTDSGVEINYFRGNHDLWTFNYFEKELNIKMYDNPLILNIDGLNLFLAHGDGLGPKDYGYKLLKKVFKCKINQIIFKILHPDIGIALALFWSGRSRKLNNKREILNNEIEKERLVAFSKEYLKKNNNINYFIFGHRHKADYIKLNENSFYINLGDWINNFSFAVLNDKKIVLKKINIKTLEILDI